MRFRRSYTHKLEIFSIFSVICTTIYRISYFVLYEYGSPLYAKSIGEYKKEYEAVNSIPYNYSLNSLPSSDYNKLIDSNFTFLTLNRICEKSNPFILIAVYTAPENFDKRKVVRETWGSKTGNVRIIFILGETRNGRIKFRLVEENKTHGDFIQGSFSDSYRNLTYKHVTMSKYSIYHCPQAKYSLKADDDIYVNMPALRNFSGEVSPAGAKNFSFCPPNYAKVVRSFRGYSSKWRLTFQEYPHKVHPPSCNGFFFVYSQNVAFFSYREAQKSGYFWSEDVHMTGYSFKKMGVDHVNARPFMVHQKKLAGLMESGAVEPWPFLFSGPDLSRREIEWLNSVVLNQTNVVF